MSNGPRLKDSPHSITCTKHSDFPCLLDICFQTVLREAGLKQILDVYDFAEELLLFTPESGGDKSILKERLLSTIIKAYPVIRELEDVDRLQAVLGVEVYTELESRERERAQLNAQLKLARSGRVVELDMPETTLESEPSVSGTGFSFPLECLVTGVKWPKEVDPNCREQYLSATCFQTVFGMTFDQFSRLPPWKQQDLKKRKKLF